MGDRKYRIDEGTLIDGRRIRVGDAEYEINLTRRGLLATGAVVAAGGVGVGAYTRQSQPSLRISGNWNANSLVSSSGVAAITFGNRTLDVSWSDMPTEELYLDWKLEAKLADVEVLEDSAQFDTIASNSGVSQTRRYSIPADETSSGSDSNIQFFNVAESSSDTDPTRFDVSSDDYMDYGGNDAVNLLNEHAGISSDEFTLDEPGSAEIPIDLQLTFTARSYATDDVIADTILDDRFIVTVQMDDDGSLDIGSI